MSALKPHTHEQRAEIVERLIEMHERELGSNLHGLATQGSFARGEDGPYSDLEIVAFLSAMPGDAQWVDREQVYDGMFVDLIWTTRDVYQARVKEVTPHWYIAGSDHLAPTRVNPELIDEINAFTPRDMRARCLAEAQKRWPALHEATTKVLNAGAREHTPDLGRLVFAMLDHVLGRALLTTTTCKQRWRFQMQDCGDNIHAGPNTSCPFAKNVREAYLAVPGDSVEIDVHSPVTDKNYTMACVRTGDSVTCRGGNQAVVKFAA